jgi:hypothetical protein
VVADDVTDRVLAVLADAGPRKPGGQDRTRSGRLEWCFHHHAPASAATTCCRACATVTASWSASAAADPGRRKTGSAPAAAR